MTPVEVTPELLSGTAEAHRGRCSGGGYSGSGRFSRFQLILINKSIECVHYAVMQRADDLLDISIRDVTQRTATICINRFIAAALS